MRILLVGITVALLHGCASDPRVETVEVKVPVPVSCVKPEDVPQEVPSATDHLKREDDPGTKIKSVLIERERLREADTVFRALIRGCLI